MSSHPAPSHSVAPTRRFPLSRFLDHLLQDLRYAARGLRRSPGFALAAVLTLALGVGANTATFSVVRGVLLRPLPYPEPERLVAAWEVSREGRSMWSAWTNFGDWRREARSFSALAAYSSDRTTVLGGSEPIVAEVAAVSEDFFRVFGVAPALGRVPSPDEHRLGATPVGVVSHGFWRTHLGDDPLAAGSRRLDVSGLSVEVVGVMPPGFDFQAGADLWAPVELTEPATDRTAHNHRVVGRLAPGASLAQAGEELQRITEGMVAGMPADDYLPVGARVHALGEQIARPVRRPLWILLGAASLVLLAACANLASGLLARGAERRQEMAVRRSLGAATGRLLRQLTTEALLLALAGAAAGLAVAAFILDLLAVLAPALPRLGEVRLDGAVLAFTLATAVGTALLFGLLPGLRVAGGDAAALRGGERAAGDRANLRTWRLLTAIEVALALVLLSGSGLLLRSLGKVLATDLGFDPEGVATVDVRLPSSRYGEDARVVGYYGEVLAELAALPGVEEAGVVSPPPLGWDPSGRIDIEGGPAPTIDAGYRVASAGYFSALGIPLLAGRLFDAGDHAAAGHVAVVSRSLAERAWPGQDPIGKRLTGGGMDSFWRARTWATVVGVVGDVRHRSLTAPFQPEVIFPYTQRPDWPSRSAMVLLKVRGSAGKLAPSLRDVLNRVDPEVPVELGTMEQGIRGSVADRRFSLALLGGFAAVALALALVGIYGVVAYTVARRRRELGIRLALGGTPARVRGQVVRQAMAGVGLGIIAGLGGALAATRLLAGLLHEVEPTDPPTFAGAVVLLGAAAWVATYLPARRATRIEPAEVIRAE